MRVPHKYKTFFKKLQIFILMGQNKTTETWLTNINCLIGRELLHSEEFRTPEVDS